MPSKALIRKGRVVSSVFHRVLLQTQCSFLSSFSIDSRVVRKSGLGGSRPLRGPGKDDLHDKHHVRLRGGIQARSRRRLDPNLSGEQAVEWNTACVSWSVCVCACVRVCVCACVRACVCACVRACMRE